MSIITRCPNCGTSLRVTPPQLQAQHGMVRCGRCAQVFDGFKTLATLPEAAPAYDAPQGVANRPAPTRQALDAPPAPSTPVAAAPPAASPVMPEPSPITPPAAVTPDAPPIPPPVAAIPEPPPIARRVALPSEPQSFSEPTVVAPEPPRFEEPAVAASESLQYEEPAVSDVGFVSYEEPVAVIPPKRRSAGWVFGVFLLLLVLVVQGVYFFRSDIAASVPEARPYLGKMCELLRCTVALPQRPRQISIEASDMQATDPASPGLIVLTATLRNHATTALGYPALDVVLTNTKEHTVARRIFLPDDYLGAGKDLRAGIAPNAEVTVRLDLETGDLGAAGFRLDLIAAPAG